MNAPTSTAFPPPRPPAIVDDFGFTAVSEDEMRQREEDLKTQLSSHLEQTEQYWKQRLVALKNAVRPLVTNLMKDAETKPYIHWPNRTPKLQQLLKQIDELTKGLDG